MIGHRLDISLQFGEMKEIVNKVVVSSGPRPGGSDPNRVILIERDTTFANWQQAGAEAPSGVQLHR